ncbi:hypothetical protein [Murimonas intestini]|uniref:hypothetical protein n=1 Tax=Murimonas intestini TaxID=1337051 RepID=UPI0016526DC2
MKLTYRKAIKDDSDLLIDIYNASFYDDYVWYGECPGYGKTKEEMESSLEDSANGKQSIKLTFDEISDIAGIAIDHSFLR